jgi:hypothetical protein
MRQFMSAPVLLSLLGACAAETTVSSMESPLMQTKDGDPVYPDDPSTPNGVNVCKTITVSGHVFYNDLRDDGRFSLRFGPVNAAGFATQGFRHAWRDGATTNYLGLLDGTVKLYEIDKSGPFEGCHNTSFIGKTTITASGYWTWSGQVCDSCRDDLEGAEDNGISIAAKVALENCSAPNTRCFSVRDPAGAPTDDDHYDDDDSWDGPTYERWLRGAHISTPVVIHQNTTVDTGDDYFQASATPTAGDISDLDAQAASVFASAVDVTRKLHVEASVGFDPGGGEVMFYFPDVKGWSHSHPEESNRVCINAPGIRGTNNPVRSPLTWFDGSDAAHEYGHLVHFWQWEGNGKWVSYAFDSNGDNDVDDEEAKELADTREYTIAALKEGWASFIEHWTFDGTGSPDACDEVETDPAAECTGPAACTFNRRIILDVKHALCDLADGTRNTEAGDTLSISIGTLTTVLAEVWNRHPLDAEDVADATQNHPTTAPFGVCDIARRLRDRGTATTTALTNTLAQSLLDCGL